MKTMMKMMMGLIVSALMVNTLSAQPKSEIPTEKDSKMNWADADTLYTYQYQESTGLWVYFEREVRRFNDKGLPTENFVQTYSQEDNSWTNYLRENYTYDQNGNEIEVITQHWDKNFKNWVNARLKTINYNGKKREEILFQEWKRPTNEWFNIMKYLITYNDAGKEYSVTINLFDGASQDWRYYKRFLMDFEIDFAPPTSVIVEDWNREKRSWQTEGKYMLSYNGRRMKTEEIRLTYNNSLRSFIEGLKFNMDYDKKGNMIEYVEQKYDLSNKTWINFIRHTATYNEKQYMTEKTEYSWDKSMDQWVEENKYKFSTEKNI
ncbi:MAG: hypothetical protein V2I54_01440 [Bacteroidales bacterium]|jgi:hypothetical protein|nr:hypothetical protein [Bacteroidales bacterium]